MTSVRRNRTTLVIAHRLSTILTADHIMVLEDGHVADVGTNRELIERPSPPGQQRRERLDLKEHGRPAVTPVREEALHLVYPLERPFAWRPMGVIR
ncbi:hypothetical protein AB0L53_06125 [Nonomuraea sp. NPDC052129]|uniref:hypothetical protein n=1 Tax=Nonomuraea sp. NPDC052129 TaxID=3154651 RepID=UPI003426F819